jgi:outer membrane receptor for ferrienterochelin and colicins
VLSVSREILAQMLIAAPLLLLTALIASPQQILRILVETDQRPVAGASVNVAGTRYVTDASGVVNAPVVTGTLRIEVTGKGFLTITKDVAVTDAPDQQLVVKLEPDLTHEEAITVSATRTDKRLDDQAMRVEVLEREEIEEKLLMTPGDIVMMLNEMGGMRVQATSAALGAASVRVQGMRGRYTRVLADGLPLFGDQTGGLGLLQIPPMDLAQVEVIKGVASALYGAGAMGGVIDLISRRPADEPEREVLLNQSTRGGTDAILWYSSPLPDRWGVTFLGGGHFQQNKDVDEDGWADLPHYARGVFRPRLFWDDSRGRSFFATVGVTSESRRGGTTGEGNALDLRVARPEALDTLRVDGGFVGRTTLSGRYVLTARGAVSHQRHDHRFGDLLERDRHQTLFTEVAVRGASGRHTWVGGLALERDTYEARDVPRFDYAFTVPGLFLQDDVEVTRWWSVSASARADHHSRYGWFVSPRLSSLVRGGGWTGRFSIGTGFFGPTALTEETEAAGLTNLVIPERLEAERGRSFSLDVTRGVGPVSLTATMFRSRISHPVHVERTSAYILTNLDQPTSNTGVELLGTIRRAPFALTGTYTYVRARERHDGLLSDVPLTPRHSAGIVAMAESERGRIGLEWYYTGRQQLDDLLPGTSEPYAIVGLLAERRFGRIRLFINGENLTDTRQTKWSGIFRPAPSADRRITRDVWAPLEGRTINGGVRFGF